MDSSASDDPVSSDSEAIKDEPKKKKIKFTPVQISRLQAMYACGTQGTGQMHLSSIQRAARDTGLEIAQVKVRKNENMLNASFDMHTFWLHRDGLKRKIIKNSIKKSPSVDPLIFQLSKRREHLGRCI